VAGNSMRVRVPPSAPKLKKRASFQKLARFHFGPVAAGLRMIAGSGNNFGLTLIRKDESPFGKP